MANYTDQQLLDAYRGALFVLATAQSYTLLGRTVTRANINDITKTIEWLEERLAAKDNPDDALGIVQIVNW